MKTPRILLCMLALLLAGCCFLTYITVERNASAFPKNRGSNINQLIGGGYFSEPASLWQLYEIVTEHLDEEEHVIGYIYLYPLFFALVLLIFALCGWAVPSIVFTILLAAFHWFVGFSFQITSKDEAFVFEMHAAYYLIFVIAACLLACCIWLFTSKRRDKKARKALAATAQ